MRANRDCRQRRCRQSDTTTAAQVTWYLGKEGNSDAAPGSCFTRIPKAKMF
jgi:hypothetical protein